MKPVRALRRQLLRRPFRARGFSGLLVALLLIGGAAVAAAHFEPVPEPISGHATVADGDTLRLGGDRIRLLGLDAPELAQTCLDARGEDWPCGHVAREKLTELVADADVRCVPTGTDRYGRLLARCTAGDTDIGAAMVAAGLAVASDSYLTEEAAARGEKLGLWQGRFDPPRRWRDAHGDLTGGFDLLGWIRSWTAPAGNS